MQRRASMTSPSSSAPVGQASRQRVQRPQCSVRPARRARARPRSPARRGRTTSRHACRAAWCSCRTSRARRAPPTRARARRRCRRSAASRAPGTARASARLERGETLVDHAVVVGRRARTRRRGRAASAANRARAAAAARRGRRARSPCGRSGRMPGDRQTSLGTRRRGSACRRRIPASSQPARKAPRAIGCAAAKPQYVKPRAAASARTRSSTPIPPL